MDLKAIKSLIKGWVLTSQNDLDLYSGDASIFRIMPRIVVIASDVDDLKNLVNFVRENKNQDPDLSITVRSAGTDMGGGPLNDSIIVDIKNFDHIIKIGKDFVEVEPGIMFSKLEMELAEKGLFFPSYPASKSICSFGGMVANNAGGEKTLRYGKTDRYISSLKVILQDGNEYTFRQLSKKDLNSKLKEKNFEGQFYRQLYKLVKDNFRQIKTAKPNVSKNSTGYALWDIYDPEKETFNLVPLFVGSQGTLGIVTQIKARVLPTEQYSQLVALYLTDLQILGKIVNECLQLHPTSLEAFDDKTLKLALKFAPTIARLISKEENLFTFALKLLPDLKIVISKGFPKLVLLVEFTSDDKNEIETKIEQLTTQLSGYSIGIHRSKDMLESQKYWTIRRQSFELLRKRIRGRQTAPFIDDFIVKPEYLTEFLPQLNQILNRYPQLEYTIAGHAGDGNFHIIPLMNLTDEHQREIIPELTDKVYKLVLKYNGSLSGEHNDGLIRGPYLERMYGKKVFNLMRQVKQIFDPANIFNPHKKTDANLNFSLSSIKKDNLHLV